MATKRRSTVVRAGQVKRTRFPELSYQEQGRGNWRLIDSETGSVVGRDYPTEKALLGDLQRQAEVRGFAPTPAAEHWSEAIRRRLTEACRHYEKTAPTVEAWANDLFVRLNENADAVVLSEIVFAEQRLFESGQWMHPNHAANAVYKLLHRLGRDTTGHAGF
jgi:hypothetical protein